MEFLFIALYEASFADTKQLLADVDAQVNEAREAFKNKEEHCSFILQVSW